MHIVYRLKNSLPKSVVIKMQREYEANQKIRARQSLSPTIVKDQDLLYETLLEDALHHNSTGPYHLSDPRLAAVVLDSWAWIAEHRNISVFAVCVMSNHIHVLARSQTGEQIDTGLIMKAHKNYTALQCNRLLEITGTSFWETGYFDRDVRPGTFTIVLWYILNNPVKAGLVDCWEEWPHTYLHPDYDLLFRSTAVIGF